MKLTRLVAEGKTARARQVMNQRSGRGTTGRRSPSALTLVLMLALSVAIAGAVIYGMSFLGLRVLERPQPVFDLIVAWLHLLSGFISICLLTGGLETIRTANNTPGGDSWEFLN